MSNISRKVLLRISTEKNTMERKFESIQDALAFLQGVYTHPVYSNLNVRASLKTL